MWIMWPRVRSLLLLHASIILDLSKILNQHTVFVNCIVVSASFSFFIRQLYSIGERLSPASPSTNTLSLSNQSLFVLILFHLVVLITAVTALLYYKLRAKHLRKLRMSAKNTCNAKLLREVNNCFYYT